MLHEPAPPTWRKGEVSTELDTTPSFDRAYADVLSHPDAEWELDAKLEVVGRRIDAVEVEAKPKTHAERATAQQHDLSGSCWSGWLDRIHPGLGPGFVSRRISQQTPDGLGRRRHGIGRADVDAHAPPSYVPTPLNVIRWVPALSVMVTRPERAPVPCGRKVTVMVQLAPDARVLPQLLLMT